MLLWNVSTMLLLYIIKMMICSLFTTRRQQPSKRHSSSSSLFLFRGLLLRHHFGSEPKTVIDITSYNTLFFSRLSSFFYIYISMIYRSSLSSFNVMNGSEKAGKIWIWKDPPLSFLCVRECIYTKVASYHSSYIIYIYMNFQSRIKDADLASLGSCDSQENKKE